MSSSGIFINPALRDPEQSITQHAAPEDGESTGHHTVHVKPALESDNRHHVLHHSELQCDERRKIDSCEALAISDNAVGAENRVNRKSGTFLYNNAASVFPETSTTTSSEDATISGKKGR